MNEITLVEFYVAYRKAKYEAYRDSNCAHGAKFVAYESCLDENLRRLQSRLNRTRDHWPHELSFIGGITYIPKSLEPKGQRREQDEHAEIHFSSSDPLENWKRESKKGVKFNAAFRPVIDATVDYMVLAALWINRVGHKYDAKLDPRHSVGNRLRRRRPRSHAPGAVGPLNLDCHSIFEYYPAAYRKWRTRGLTAMRTELKATRAIVAMTMDLKQFYHRIDPTFLTNKSYLALSGVSLTAEDLRFTRQFVRSLQTWNASAGDTRGLPVGLTASGLIANVLLLEFDRRIRSDLQPIYYGRYVDDIFLVMRQKEEFLDGRDVLRWLADRLDGLATFIERSPDGPVIRLLLPTYGRETQLEFVGKKQKIFRLQGESGLDLLAPIEEQLRKQSSEYRALPDLPDTESGMADRALLVTSDATLEADGLRKADSVTLRRAGFAILLRDIERHAKYLDPDTWETLRKHFYGLVSRHLITPQGFFAYFRFIPRVMSLMTECGDFDSARKFVLALGKTMRALRATCAASKTKGAQLRQCEENLVLRFFESIAKESTRGEASRPLARLLGMISAITSQQIGMDAAELATLGDGLFDIDWATLRYAEAWMTGETGSRAVSPLPKEADVKGALPLVAMREVRKLAGLRKPRWTALAFPTRPIRLNEIVSKSPDLLGDWDLLRSISMGLCGAFMPVDPGIRIVERRGRPDHYHIPLSTRDWSLKSPRIAVTNFETTVAEWEAAVHDTPALSLSRFRKLSRVINDVLVSVPRPDYVILPECSLPRRWADFVAYRLGRNAVSLIAGLEYRRSAEGIHNEALVSFVTDYAGYRSALTLRQTKQSPAWHERLQVEQRVGLSIVEAEDFWPPVYIHEDFALGVLICSDLTDIVNRAHFRGQIDCLFVPEWNSDLETFSALVESATLDIHAYVVQANNRLYGDGRIRGPYKLSHARDVIRIRGGIHDYVVVGEIDHLALRRFQSHAVPPEGSDEVFKPYPIGFQISSQRHIQRGQ